MPAEIAGKKDDLSRFHITQHADAQISYEEYPDRGHSYLVTEAVRDWYEVERRRGTDGLAATARAKVIETLAAEFEPWDRYQAIDGLRRGPWYFVAPAEARQECDAVLELLAKDPVLKSELRARRSYQKVLAREVAQRGKPVRARSVAEADEKIRKRKRGLLDEYRKLGKRFAGTTYGEKAKVDVDRVNRHLRHMGGR